MIKCGCYFQCILKIFYTSHIPALKIRTYKNQITGNAQVVQLLASKSHLLKALAPLECYGEALCGQVHKGSSPPHKKYIIFSIDFF